MHNQNAEMPIVSVIIPAYNVEKFIHKSIKSVCRQGITNIEIIVVDDGSKDKTLAICQKYSQHDLRVFVLHQNNAGVSSARNRALEQARGRYICFLDADDWLAPDALKQLLSLADKKNKGLYCGSINVVATTNHRIIQNCDAVVTQNDSEQGAQTVFSCEFPLGYIAGKLLNRDIIRENGLRFDETMKYSEDACFIYRYLRYCDCIKSTSTVVYNYNRINNAAATSHYCSNKTENMLRFFQEQMVLVHRDINKPAIVKCVSENLLLQIKDNCAYHVYYATNGPDKARMIESCNMIYSFIQDNNVMVDDFFRIDPVGKWFIERCFDEIYSYYYEIYLQKPREASGIRKMCRNVWEYVREAVILHSPL